MSLIPAQQALERLREGNRRFVSGLRSSHTLPSPVRRRELVEGQQPFAVIVGCSDSRVPPETVFDQGLGDLFVIRAAGHVIAPPQIGSVEFAAVWLGTRLVVVLGHSGCGAVEATLEHLAQPSETLSPHLRSIVERIRPSLESLVATELRQDPAALMRRAVRENVRAATHQLQRESEIIAQLARDDGLLVVGAEYSLETGVVHFFEDTSEPG